MLASALVLNWLLTAFLFLQKLLRKIMSVGEDCVPSIETLPAFYPPNAVKEEFEITNREYEQIKEALKKEEFRKLLVEYVEDVQVCVYTAAAAH